MRPTVNSIVKSFQNSEKKHFLITGNRGIGKTTLFLKLKEMLCGALSTGDPVSCVVPGITTYIVPREKVMLRNDLTGEEAVIGRFRDEWMETVENGFQELGVQTIAETCRGNAEDAKVLDDAKYCGWFTIDEIGFLESKVEEFKDAIRQVFEEKQVLAVLRKQDIPFLNELKNREDVYLIDMDEMRLNVGCVIMASGISRRFGENKLLVDFCGQTLIEKALVLTEGDLFARRIVVTRTKEVYELCRTQEIEVILHEYPGRGDAVRLGMEQMMDMDGCLFCPCDQPLLNKKSLGRMVGKFTYGEKKIFQLGFGDESGAPVLFAKDYFEELCHLPEKSGGSRIIRKHPEMVDVILAESELELRDMDTREEYERILEDYFHFLDSLV